MAQFRTSADILDEILLKSGEPTNGNSPFESRAVTYANKVHHAIIGGGNIFNLNVDEPWVWARSHSPIVIELMPAYTTGSVSCTQDSISITFSVAPTSSLEGWHFQVNGKGTVYKITQHTASSTSAVIDSAFVSDTNSYSFRAFQLDYKIQPSYMYVDNTNDKIDFMEGTASTVSATLTHGSYTPANLISHMATVLQAAGTKTYAGAYDSVLQSFSLTQTGTVFSVLPVTGANFRRNGMTNAGFDIINYTGAQSYTSTYTPNQVGRLIEPFKLFTMTGFQPFVYSSDPIKMQEDFPISLTRECVPSRFVRLSEDGSGGIWVRFNSYPHSRTKIQIDWIPQPVDIQDNRASFPLLPRADLDTLIHGACAFLAFDKEDSKWQGFLDLAKAGLESMKKKNHGALFRTGTNFGQIIPRLDLYDNRRRLFYGSYGSTAVTTTSSSTPADSMLKYILGYGRFSAGGTVASATAAVLPSNCASLAFMIQLAQSFTGPLISGVILDVGTQADPTQFINAFDVAQATPANVAATTFYFPAVDTPIMIRVTTTGAAANALSAGMINLYIEETTVP